jgi:hypothetical protein
MSDYHSLDVSPVQPFLGYISTYFAFPFLVQQIFWRVTTIVRLMARAHSRYTAHCIQKLGVFGASCA